MEQNENLKKKNKTTEVYENISATNVINFLKLFKIMGNTLRDILDDKNRS